MLNKLNLLQRLVRLRIKYFIYHFSVGKVSIKAAINLAISYFPLALIFSNTSIAYCFN